MSIETPVVSPVASTPARGRWRFFAALAVQVGLVLTVPAPNLMAYAFGQPVTLSITPVDPYDMLKGRYMRLDYPLGGADQLKALPGWKHDYETQSLALYVTLRPAGAQKAWKATALGETPPDKLPADAVVLKGQLSAGKLDIGMGEYMLPEGRGDAAEAGLRRHPESALAELKVDRWGHAVLTGLLIDGQRY